MTLKSKVLAVHATCHLEKVKELTAVGYLGPQGAVSSLCTSHLSRSSPYAREPRTLEKTRLLRSRSNPEERDCCRYSACGRTEREGRRTRGRLVGARREEQ